MSEIVAAQGRTLSRPLANKGGKALTGSNGAISTVTFTAEEEANCKLLYRIRIKASGRWHVCSMQARAMIPTRIGACLQVPSITIYIVMATQHKAYTLL